MGRAGQDTLLPLPRPLPLFWEKQRAKGRRKAGKIIVWVAGVDGDTAWLHHSHPLALGDGAEAGQLGEEEMPQGDVIKNNVCNQPLFSPLFFFFFLLLLSPRLKKMCKKKKSVS